MVKTVLIFCKFFSSPWLVAVEDLGSKKKENLHQCSSVFTTCFSQGKFGVGNGRNVVAILEDG
jgi:hypothetical protein